MHLPVAPFSRIQQMFTEDLLYAKNFVKPCGEHINKSWAHWKLTVYGKDRSLLSAMATTIHAQFLHLR